MDMRASARPTSLTAPRGRPFLNGNPGRKLGSKNRSTVIAAALLEDQKSALLRKGIELALAGDVHMLKFFLGRPKPAEASLGLHASAKLRERLILEIGRLSTSDGAAEWEGQNLPEKNRLRAADAAQVEAGFEAKLAQLTAFSSAAIEVQQVTSVDRSARLASKTNSRPDESSDRSKTIDKSVLALPEPRRIRDRDHIRLVTARPCIVCGRLPSDPHHLRFAQSRALSRKVSDEFTVPLCRGHHRELHRHGDEAAWWSRHGIDLLGVARTPCAPWEVLESHPLPATQSIVSENVGPTTSHSKNHKHLD
jgi:hypothetical protein